METCIMWEIPMLDLKDHSTEMTLCQLIMNLLDPANPASRLFHLANKVFSNTGYILHFHPTPSQNARDVIAGLCVYMKGLWQGITDDNKFNNFFTDMALDCTKDAWWDLSQKCAVTQADEEMVAILQADKDLIFSDKKVIVNLPVRTTMATTTQQNNDLLSTVLVSTFCTNWDHTYLTHS